LEKKIRKRKREINEIKSKRPVERMKQTKGEESEEAIIIMYLTRMLT
jgi:hypothetical protein